MWRLGMQCEGSVRDPIRLAALAQMNQVGRPSGLGIQAEAPLKPYRSAEQPTGGRWEKNGSASSGLG